MLRNKTARQHNFAVVPKAEIPRSKFAMRQTRKMAFNASELIPIMVEEVLPGDTWSHKEHIAARLATPIAPILDDMHLETFYFFVPNRITWPSWEDFITGVNTALQIPLVQPARFGIDYELVVGSVFDHMGLPPQTYSPTSFSINVLPIWSYFTIWNEWFRDQNLQEPWEWSDTWTISGSPGITQGTAPTRWDQMPLRVNKRHDYFTSSLPWPQKGSAVTLPLGTTAPVIPDPARTTQPYFEYVVGGANASGLTTNAGGGGIDVSNNTGNNQLLTWNDAAGATGLLADLSAATAATINAIRLAFQTQKLLERDARGGSRYVEQLMSHFGTRSPDYRLQRPEYLGGSKLTVAINPVTQTAAYNAEPDPENESALGNLGAEMHAGGTNKTFTYAAVEHGYIIGLATVRSTPTYQQGVRRHWRRDTRLSYYFPVFAMLGEQAVLTQEIYQPANNAPANPYWGYQERWAEMRYTPNEITGVLRSTVAQPMDWWHLAEEYGAEPALNASFITDKTQETLARALATAPNEQWSAQIIMDIMHDSQVARLMPTYSVPGQVDRF